MKLILKKIYLSPVFYLLLIFLAQLVFVNASGEFALNDDWVHAWTIQHWLDTGEFVLLPWAGPTFYVPILYGTILAKLFGFSFSMLRISTLAISLCTIIIFYLFLFTVTKNKKLSFAFALILLFNPIFYNLSFTFMTDVPALLLLLLSIYAYYKGVVHYETTEKRYSFWFMLGTVLSVIGFYIRQTNILLIIPFGMYALYKHKQYGGIYRVLYSFAIPSLAAALVYTYLYTQNLLPQGQVSLHFLGVNNDALKHSVLWLWQYSLLIGFFLLPITVGWFVKNYKKMYLVSFSFFFCLFIVLSLFMDNIYQDRLWHVGNIITPHGLGPSLVLHGMQQAMITPTIQILYTAMSAAGVVLLIYAMNIPAASGRGYPMEILHSKPRGIEPLSAFGGFKNSKKDAQEKNKEETLQTQLYVFIKLLFVFCFFYLLLVVFILGFDRYILPVFTMLLIAIAQKLKQEKLSYTAVISALFLFAFFSVTQTQHYLEWNRARWELGKTALHNQDETFRIDGGYEWNGWHSYWSAHDSGLAYGKKTSPWWIRSVFVNNTEEYIISFSPLPGYDVIESRTIESINPNNTLYLLQVQE